jgi:hypothetical protein
LEASKRTEEKADRQMDTWKANQNEWQRTFRDKDSLSMSRREWDEAHKRLVSDTETLRRQFESHLADYMGNRAAWTRMMTLAGVVAAVFGTLSGAMVAILHYMNAPK